MHSASERAVAVSALRNDVSEWKRRAGAKKDFETEHSSVFAAPGSPLAHFLTAESGLNRWNALNPIHSRLLVEFALCRNVPRGRNSSG
jgi:hypothetical protein